MNNNQANKDNDTRKIFTTLVLVLTLMIFTTGATYAYFALSASINNTISGTAATASLSFVNSSGDTITAIPYLAPTSTTAQSKPMVPQYSYYNNKNVLQLALTANCVDANSNTICKAYTFTIKNTSSATAVIKGQIKFTWGADSSFENLKWKLMQSATEVSTTSTDKGTVASTNFVNFAENIQLAPNETQTFNLIIWIEEIGTAQNSKDYGSFFATIQFVNQVDNSGITSTITG